MDKKAKKQESKKNKKVNVFFVFLFSGCSEKGFTLLELIVAVGVFAIIALSATSIFQKVVEGQRRAIAAQNTQESVRYVLETISKEIRNAKVNDDSLPSCSGIDAGKIFKLVSASELKFKNQYGSCVIYKIDSSAFKISRDNGTSFMPITPDNVQISNLNFILKNGGQNAVAVVMKIENNTTDIRFKLPLELQTTISSRYYTE
ncbi:MAG: type II secretion system GspH family protein [Methanoregula sp.]|jgi:prepilin-type N-terminal cleavage/methylation domain-containing protein|nr:type II secretion system GspH family protein [Methanoregula sp.]